MTGAAYRAGGPCQVLVPAQERSCGAYTPGIMVRVIEAIYTNGVLKPTEPLVLREQERVRVTIESVGGAAANREEALRALRAGFDQLKLRINGRLPSREELHERR